MSYFCKTVLALLITGFSTTPVFAASFIVRDIQIQGLQGISRDTVLSYLPVQAGQRFDSTNAGKVIHTLYNSGFFEDVKVAQQGNSLIIKVVERPVIGSLAITGNKAIPKDKLDEVLKQQGLIQGRIFDNATLERIKTSLQSEYDNLGKYNAVVFTSVTPQENNRVAVKIDISEGQTVQVHEIRIIGNQAFSNKKLVSEMELTTPRFWSFLTRGDQYSQEKLDTSLEALRSYYLNRGYLKFKIDSAQASLTPDRKSVYINIKVTEGPIYTFKSYHLSGNLVLSETKLHDLIKLKPGSVFSRQAVQDANEAISKALGNMGYAFATVNPVPEIDEANKQVSITFYVDPGNRVYVRRINVEGNIKTQDGVVRRVMHQMEGSLVSTDDVKESERQLNLSGYFENVQVNTLMVPGMSDLVDLNYKVTEAPAAQAIFGVGYGTDGFLVNASLNQPNFLGSGNSLGLNFNNSRYATTYSINYTNPYYTFDGISRSLGLYVQRTTPANVNIAHYSTDVYGASVNYGIPISARGDTLQLGVGYQTTVIKLGSAPSNEVINFTNDEGKRFNQILLTTGWNRNGLDRAFFPTKGLYQDSSLQLALPGGGNKNVSYYKASYDLKFYQPLSENFIITASGGLGYGNGLGSTKGLPFFGNYYAGGIGGTGQVRGYETNSLGPLDSNGDALGGNILTTASLGLVFPNFISPDKLRTTAFVDAGNVRSTQARAYSGSNAGPLRYSAGISADWRVPVLNVILDISLAKALNAQKGDQKQVFQFNIGTSF